MGRDTELRGSVHLESTNLNLERNAVLSDDRRVQGLVHIGLRHRDVVLKTSGNRSVHLVNHAQNRITVPHRLHDNTNGKEVINLVNGLILIHHLFVNGKEMLNSTLNVRFNAAFFDVFPHFLHNRVNPILSCLPLKMHFVRKIIIDFRLQIL